MTDESKIKKWLPNRDQIQDPIRNISSEDETKGVTVNSFLKV